MSLRWRAALVLNIVFSVMTTLCSLYVLTRLYRRPLVFAAAVRTVRACATTGYGLVRPSGTPRPPLGARTLTYLSGHVALIGAATALGMYVMTHMAIAPIMVVDALYPCVLLLFGALGVLARRLRPSYAYAAASSVDLASCDYEIEDDSDPPSAPEPAAPRLCLRAGRAGAVLLITLGSVLTVIGPGGAPLGWAALELLSLVFWATESFLYTDWLKQPGWTADHIARVSVWPQVALMTALAAVAGPPRSWRELLYGVLLAVVYTLIDLPRWRIALYVQEGEGMPVDPVVMSVIGNVSSLAVICINTWLTASVPTNTVIMGIGVSLIGVVLFSYASSRLSLPAARTTLDSSDDFTLDS